jgi:hypothetical protein
MILEQEQRCLERFFISRCCFKRNLSIILASVMGLSMEVVDNERKNMEEFLYLWS